MVSTADLSREYVVSLLEGEDGSFRWMFRAGLAQDEEGGTNVYIFGADREGYEDVWYLVSVASIADTVVLDGDVQAERALVCAVTAQTLDDLASLAEEPDAPDSLRILGSVNLAEGAGTARDNAVDLLESRGDTAPVTALVEDVWSILAGGFDD